METEELATGQTITHTSPRKFHFHQSPLKFALAQNSDLVYHNDSGTNIIENYNEEAASAARLEETLQLLNEEKDLTTDPDVLEMPEQQINLHLKTTENAQLNIHT